MPSVGLDFGSVTVKGVLLREDGSVERSVYRRRGEGELEALVALLRGEGPAAAGKPLRLAAVGIGDGKIAGGRIAPANGILAVAAGVAADHPGARSVIEVGGHTSKFLVLDGRGEVRDFATNEACAAGTGSFLEQQARRLGLDAERLSALAAAAPRAATVAGRCSVFAASDMIHLQQKGTPLPEIAYGLCVAIARNYLATLLKGREVSPPVVIAGGCARSEGILRAFREVLGLREGDLLAASAHPGLEGAIGAAASLGPRAPLVSPDDACRLVATLAGPLRRESASLPRLVPPSSRPREVEPTAAPSGELEGYLGIDVGSVSTDLVVLDAEGEPVSSVYLPTRGRPAEVLLEGLALLSDRFGSRLKVLGCGVTGSGRHLAARIAGADVVKNEITCQLLGAQRYVPDVDTVLEIGGQDSKFIGVSDGAIADFAMNKVCAAGTGSFLEERARDLGVDVKEGFAPLAFASPAPLDLGSRCTVFMETEVAAALGAGAAVEEISAGLAFSIARNYLEKVVGSRRVGRRVVFQGGVASNAAVVAAFESVLGRGVLVHPYNRISGAIGAALAARTARRASPDPPPSRFEGFRARTPPSLRSFECRQCSNRCEVNVVESSGGAGRAYFGDTCERYTAAASPREHRLPNVAEEYVTRCEALFSGGEASGLSIGIPRSSSLLGALPFWATFWKELGHRPVLSEPSSPETLARGLRRLSVGVCLPVKLTAGHVEALLTAGVDRVFVPALVVLPGEEPERSFACPYTMAVPFIVGAGGKERFLSPAVSFEGEEAFAAGFAPHLDELGVSADRVREAFRAAAWAQRELDSLFRARARALVASAAPRRVFAVLGRPYATLDAYVNLGLFERLRRLDVLGLPLGLLPLPDDAGRPSSPLPWRFPGDLHEAALALGGSEAIDPVLLTFFGCGPDAFALREAGEALAGRPHLVLELDEHRGEAGLVTRIEAFLDQLDSASRPRQVRRAPAGRGAALPARPSVVKIPYFADAAYAYCGLLRHVGHDASVLPLPGPEVRALGERHSLGKECHAFSMLSGDLLRLAEEARGERVDFYFPGTSIPCLLHEYGRGMQSLLRELGIANVTVFSPNGAELIEACGVDAVERLYVGLMAVELLGKAVCQVRPYEREKGTTDRVHRENLSRVEAAVAEGDVLESLGTCLRALAAVPVGEERSRPVVGLAGDIYTKVNPVANQDLARWLEERGLEVWPSPHQIDVLDFGISRRLYRSLGELDLTGLLVHGGVALRRAVDLFRMRGVVGSRVTRREEPGYLEMRKLASPYMPVEAHELLFVNVAKIVDFARGGADGIVNAICFGCMVGNASAAVIERIRRDHDDVPIVTAVYAGGDDPSRRMVLEAFVSQVRAHHRRRLERERSAEETPAALLRGWLAAAAARAGRLDATPDALRPRGR